jgi:hypothetical protein
MRLKKPRANLRGPTLYYIDYKRVSNGSGGCDKRAPQELGFSFRIDPGSCSLTPMASTRYASRGPDSLIPMAFVPNDMPLATAQSAHRPFAYLRRSRTSS